MRERDEFELVLNQAGYHRRMTTPGACGSLSIKDMLAQILAHEQDVADRMQEALQGEVRPPAQTWPEYEQFLARFGYPDFSSPLQIIDHSNEWVVEKYRGVPLDEVVAQDVNAFNAIINGLENMNDEQLDRHNFIQRVHKATIQPYHKYRYEIAAWLAGQENTKPAE